MNSTKSTALTEVREENIMRQRARFFAFFLLVVIGATSQYAQAANSDRELRQTEPFVTL